VQKYLHYILQFSVSYPLSVSGRLCYYNSTSINITVLVEKYQYFNLWHCKSRTVYKFYMIKYSENLLKAEQKICRICYVTEQGAHSVPNDVYKSELWSNGVVCEESELIVLFKTFVRSVNNGSMVLS
jgi:hypothetical protein